MPRTDLWRREKNSEQRAARSEHRAPGQRLKRVRQKGIRFAFQLMAQTELKHIKKFWNWKRILPKISE